MLEAFLPSRKWRIVAGMLASIGLLYAVTAIMYLRVGDMYHALVDGLVLGVVMGLAVAAWLKSCNRPVPRLIKVLGLFLASGLVALALSR